MILIIAEHDNNKAHDSLRSALAAAKLLNAAGDEGAEVLLAGHNCRAAAEHSATIKGIAAVKYADAPQLLLAENFAALVAAQAENYSHILMCASAKARAVLARAAALCDCQMISDITEVRGADIFVRPIYAGNALTVVQSGDRIQFLSVRASAFDNGEIEEQSAAAIEEWQAPPDAGLSEIIGEKVSEQTRPELTGARIVVSGGRGIGSADNFKILEALADKLGAALGASRAAVDAGYVSNDFQVGQTGKIVAPDLYIAVGISGAIQHIAGIKDAKCIVAINKDGDAPIFDIADYGLVGDLFDEVPALQKALAE
ncbi:MAG: electron transfer flavoprotein subunit alpha/FixB family protein [Gammaproteobacteria bacterium]